MQIIIRDYLQIHHYVFSKIFNLINVPFAIPQDAPPDCLIVRRYLLIPIRTDGLARKHLARKVDNSSDSKRYSVAGITARKIPLSFPVFFFLFSSLSDEHTHSRTRDHPASSFRKRYRTRGTGLYHPRYRVFSRLCCRKSLPTSLGSHTCHKRYRGWMLT